MQASASECCTGYFRSKQAVVLALYDELSTEYGRQAAGMPIGKWRDRFMFALKTSLRVLEPHRMALRALTARPGWRS